LRSLFRELKHRRVFRVAIAYVVVAFAVLQGADVLATAMALPEWALALVVFLMIIGFPVATGLAWAFDVGPEGVRRAVEPEVDGGGAAAGPSSRGVRIAAAAMLVLVTLSVGGWWLYGLGNGAGSSNGAALARAGAVIPSIAVLPFVNMSADPENEYFSDGISEELLNLFAQVRGLQVAARTSSFAFKDRGEDVSEIARQLRVGNVLEGSVRRQGGRVRITAQLIEAGTGYHVWSESYDRDLADVFVVQEEIARAIVSALMPHLGVGAAGSLATPTGTADPRAHDLYLLGLRDWHRRGDAPLRAALDRFSEAVRLDPSYAAAHAGIALTHSVLPMYSDFPVEQSVREGKAAGLRALELRPHLAEAHAALGQIAQNWEWDWTTAEREYDRALELSPNYATAHMWRCELLTILQRHDEALRACRSGLALDPLAPVAHNQIASAHMWAGRQDSAGTGFLRALELDPNFRMAADNLGASRLLARDFDGWLRVVLQMAADEKERRFYRTLHAGWSRPGDAAARSAALVAIGDFHRNADEAQLHIPVLHYKLLGENDLALDAFLEVLDVMRIRAHVPYALGDPLMHDVADDPRYRELVRRMNLPFATEGRAP
jgi:TolB-like protein/tetratricopeptide (TPR) repeat protein